MTNNTLVMGPDANATHSSVLSPPKLTSHTDKYQWRIDVNTWTKIVKQYAKGGDNRAKGALSALGLTLYLSLERDQQNIVDNAVQCGSISFDLDDDDEVKPLMEIAKEQFKLVDNIVSLVAKDTPTDGIRRLVMVSQGIYHCIRDKSEKPHIFARKFQGLAKRYLTMSNSPHDNQNLAILLLENAKLPSATFNNIVTQLVTKSANRAENPTDATVTIPVNMLTAMLEQTAETSGAMMAWQASTGPTAHDQQTQTLVNQTYDLMTVVKSTASNIRELATQATQGNRSAYTITLDDAVDALWDMNADEDTISKHEKSPENECQKKGSMMTKRKEGIDSTRQPSAKRFKFYIPPGTGKKKDSICKACNKVGHWKGEYICEQHPMHKQCLEKSTKREDEDEKRTVEDTDTQYFQ